MTSVFVPAGTVHAIGGGLVLAEIQQNSDLTYRLYDWGRADSEGKPRELHVAKALEAIHFGVDGVDGADGVDLTYDCDGARVTVLAACRHFAAELVEVADSFRRDTRGETFHIVLCTSGSLVFGEGGKEDVALGPGEALLVPGAARCFEAAGRGAFLDYYVPDQQRDVVQPLLEEGHGAGDIGRLVRS